VKAFDGKLDPRQRTVEEIRRYLGADSLGYLSLESLRRAVEDTRGTYCTSCYTGVYPVDGAQAELDGRAIEHEEPLVTEIQAVPNER
jgi:glutamine phosphoribosylpyrophosphate amidotransferase